MRTQDVMSKAVQTIAPNVAADVAWEKMGQKGIRHLVVVDKGEAVGVVSDRDVGGRRGAALRAGRTVADMMSTPALSVPPTTTVRKAANLMRGRSIGCLVVVDGKKVVGIITVADLLELIGRGVDQPVATSTRWTLKHRVAHKKQRAGSAW